MSSRPVRRPSRSRSANVRSWSSHVEGLETRQLLSTLPVSQPMYQVGALVSNTSPPSGAYTPAQIKQAYQYNAVSFNGTAGNGAGETIAIVDAYNDPNIQADLNKFDAQFGLASTTVTVVNQSGGTGLPAADSSGGWELEESLDVEWAHAMAPGAKILLVEARSANDSDLLAGVSYAAAHANVVSMSWGGGEFPGELSYDSTFSKAGVAFVASSGDRGAPVSWPAASPNVLAVGGTALTLSGGNWSSEAGWGGSGGGPSAYESQPSYQSGVVTATTMRANPDVAYDASPSTGFAVYDSYAYGGTSYGWMQIGGTSAGAPQWAAILAIADQGRAAAGQKALNSSNPQGFMTVLYKNPGDFHDITSGKSTGSPNYSAGSGYDYVTGLGSPRVGAVIGSLDPSSTTAAPDTLVVSAPTTTTAGKSFSFTVTAEKAGTTTVDTGFKGTVSFTSTDGKAVLPGRYTFTASDAGKHTFTVTLKTAGSRKVTAADGSTSAASTITVTPAAASHLVLSGLSSSTTAGVAHTLTVTARDAYGNAATGYRGTVQLTSSDAKATLSPGRYTFTTTDKGVHTFQVTFGTPGTQSVTVADTASSGLKATVSGINVSLAAPTKLTATAASSSQINLSWTASAGAGGYRIQRSTNSTSGWTTIGTTAAGTTTYQDKTGLSAGTTYDFRVIATASSGSITSSPSNVASATTTGGTGTVGSTSYSVWGNSYSPSEDAYSSGPYELGMKFRSSVAGAVTGVRFYKQTWMGGYTHVGHLWSSSGTLLATATFANETSSGWEQVKFSSPVTIQPDITYIVSFSTGGGYFGISSGYFGSAAVTNGPLSALAGTTSGGNGVYQTAGGQFPTLNGYGMNFWVDVAFSPASGGSVKTAAATGSTTTTTSSGRSGYFVSPAPTAAPAGPVGLTSDARGTSATAGQPTTVGVAYRRNVTQGRTTTLWGSQRTSFLS